MMITSPLFVFVLGTISLVPRHHRPASIRKVAERLRDYRARARVRATNYFLGSRYHHRSAGTTTNTTANSNSFYSSESIPLELASVLLSGVLTESSPQKLREGCYDGALREEAFLSQYHFTHQSLLLGKERAPFYRRPIIAGNWKCNPSTVQEATALLTELADSYSQFSREEQLEQEVVIFPPMAYLGLAISLLQNTGIQVGCQNISCLPPKDHDSCSSSRAVGAFTGEVTASMVASMGCQYVMIGHSERRLLFQEHEDMIHSKILSVLQQQQQQSNQNKNELKIILCVGEKEEEMDFTSTVLQYQIQKALKGISRDDLAQSGLVIAYEPVWAIGSGLSATSSQIQSAHDTIRETLAQMYDHSLAQSIRIQYGGSVQPNSIQSLLQTPNVDGALVGGASLTSKSFTRILSSSSSLLLSTHNSIF
jgi:triosephosphate isomerase